MPFSLGQRQSPLHLAVLISGSGTTLRNLIEKIDAGKLDAKIEVVISSSAKAGGLEIAKTAGIPSEVVARSQFKSADEFSEATFDPCRQSSVDIVAMGGYLKHVLVPPDFENRVTNIHPALIPNFCGTGMYGHYVHEAVLQSGSRMSGCTVHFVDN